MLLALGSPLSLLLLLVSFLFAATLHGWVQALVARRTGDRTGALSGRTRPDPRRHLDPYGTLAAAIAGVGWAKPVDPPDRRRRGARVQVLLSGAVANLVVGTAALVAVGVLYGGGAGAVVELFGPTQVLQKGLALELGQRALLLFGLANLLTGALSLVPLPPLDGGRLMFGLAPQSEGWRKAEHQLDDRNIGIAVLLALLLIPLAGSRPLLSFVLDTLTGPLVRLVTGG